MTLVKNRVGQGYKKPTLLAAALVLGASVGAGSLLFAKTNAQAQEANQSRIAPYANAPASFADLVERVRPSVVSIYVTGSERVARVSRKKKGRGAMPDIPDIPENHPLYKFFKKFKESPQGRQQGRRGRKHRKGRGREKRAVRAQGSGFLISGDGYVVTNHHVIKNGKKIQVGMDDDTKYEAKLIGSDKRTDLALLKIVEKKEFPYVRFANIKTVRVGDWVLAVGNPFGLSSTVTAGIVSNMKRDIGSGPYDYMQIDAAVNKGNSGGPAFNMRGEVVGVNSAIYSPSGGNVGIAFSIPADTAHDVIERLKKYGTVARGWLGVQIQDVDEDMAASQGLKKAAGALVGKVTDNSPASKSTMKAGDIIYEVNGVQIEDSRDLARRIAELDPKSIAKIKVYRNGITANVDVKLGLFPGSKKLASLEEGEMGDGSEVEALGLSLAAASEFAEAGDKGVVITDVDPDSSAAEKGLQTGDIILGINGKIVSSPSEVAKIMAKVKASGRLAIMLRVKSSVQKTERFVALKIKKKG